MNDTQRKAVLYCKQSKKLRKETGRKQSWLERKDTVPGELHFSTNKSDYGSLQCLSDVCEERIGEKVKH